ncbi:retrovirus-related pol polyprotein from transposon TNT 1-94 [Tanacetum coccineum]
MENLNEVRVKELRSDNRTEFRNHKLEEFYDENGISQNFSSPCTPEQNGVAERRNKTLIEAARTMLNSFRKRLGQSNQVFNIRRKEMEEILHLTFSEDDEAISQSSTECDDYFSYVPAYDPLFTNNITILDHVIPSDSPNLQDSSNESPKFTIANDHPSKEKHIDLVNIIGEPLAGVTTRSRVRDSEVASAHECLYANFLSKIEPKKLIEALKERWIIAMKEELN